MLEPIGRRAVQSLLVMMAVACLPSAAPAGSINVILGNMDVSYLGSAAGGTGALFDAMGGLSGGLLAPATADEITTATFELNNVVQGSLMNGPTSLYGDLKIDGVGASIPKNTFLPSIGTNGGGFGFDFFTSDGFKLRLGITSISAFINDGIFLFFGTASVDLNDQNLPFNLEFTSPTVQFSFTATSVSVPNVSPITLAMGSGAFTITGEGQLIPEPATALMLCTGFVVVGLVRRRSRRTK